MSTYDGPSAQAPDPRIAQAAQGDRSAAQALLRELLPRVRNLIRYLVRGDADVDDIAQIALVEIVRSLSSYRGEGSLRSWSDRITTRVTLAYVKRRRREHRRASLAGPDLHLVTAPGEPPDGYSARRALARCLDELPDDQRRAVVLHHVLGLSVPEVAAELEIPFETARSRLRLGMEKLRQRVADRREP